MSGFIIETTITGPPATLGEFRTQFLGSFPVIEKDRPEEIIVTLSGGDLDPRPTLLNLSGEFRHAFPVSGEHGEELFVQSLQSSVRTTQQMNELRRQTAGVTVLPRVSLLLHHDGDAIEERVHVFDTGALFGGIHGHPHGLDVVEPELRDAIHAVQHCGLWRGTTSEDVILPICPHGRDLQRERTVHMTPVLGKLGEIDIVAFADQPAADDHGSLQFEVAGEHRRLLFGAGD